MSRTLALALGWVAPSERFTKTIERAQLAAYHEGAPEVTAEHLFSAALEDVDAVYFLARHEIPLAMLEGSKIPAGPAVQNVPRLAPPSYSPPWTGTTPHLDIPASAGLRRIVSLASALAEGRSMIEVHGGLAIEAILEDGRSQAAKTLKMAHAEVAQQSGRRLSPLPGSAHSGAVVMVQPPQKSEPRPQPAPPPKPALNSLEQVRWLKEQVARALEQERPYRFIQELSAFAGQNRPFSSMAAFQLREEAQADLAVNPVYLAQGELQAVERAVEEADARVRQAALRIA
ncbi:MAG: hypothetical protein HY765_10840, partial [Rhodomicrobium sp.]|nr:hypothetical protein [Rhodomicrobium sp.]